MKQKQRYGPWICKRRSCGDWVVEQFDYVLGVTRRFGTFLTEVDARDTCELLRGEKGVK